METHIQTVLDMDQFMAELKSTAETFIAQFGTSSRGYFTAFEDDQVLALLASYTQARRALLDLIDDCRRTLADPDLEAASYDCVFLAALAAAYILIDAARFLREVTAERPFVRQKLNMPSPTFGIPGGTYDHVQKSLFSARNAYHILSAQRILRERSASIEDLTRRDPQVRGLLQVIQRLQPRLEVSLDRYAQIAVRTRSDRWLRAAGRNLVQSSLYRIQKFVSTMISDVYVRAGHLPQLPALVVREVNALIRPGDILVVRKEYALTNYFLPGYWPHAALYVGHPHDLEQLGIANHEHVAPHWSHWTDDPTAPRVLESLKDGVRIRDWKSPLSSDSLILLRPQLPGDLIAQGIARTIRHAGKPYDFSFDFRRSDRLVCTEVIYRAYDGLGNYELPLTFRAGRPTLSGGDLVALALEGQLVKPICCYAPSFSDTTQVGEAVRKIISRAMATICDPFDPTTSELSKDAITDEP